MEMEEREQTAVDRGEKCEGWCPSRRSFLFSAGLGALSTMLLPGLIRNAWGQPVTGRLTAYPRKLIGKVSLLKQDEIIRFNYPQDHINCSSFLVKLGVPAHGGVGPQKDIVSFSSYCTHMGGVLIGKSKRRQKYQPAHKIVGPCPMHLSTFDLTRHGIMVTGNATQSLPQIVLETKGDDIYATGVLGLLFGLNDNLVRLQV